MLRIHDREHFRKVVRFARATGQMASLRENLTYLARYAEHGDRGKTRCDLYPDSLTEPGFFFRMSTRGKHPANRESYTPWFVGGCLYHGKHDGFGSGSGPTFAVCLTPTQGWSIHT